MKHKYTKTIRKRNRSMHRSLNPENVAPRHEPMFTSKNIHYEVADRVQSTNCGGIGAIHLMAQKLGLVDDIDRHFHLLKIHLPYHDSDHVLNIALNIVVGGQRLEDIELRRRDEV